MQKRTLQSRATVGPITHHELAKVRTHEDEKIALLLALAGDLQYGIFFDELIIVILRTVVLKSLYDLMFDELKL